VHKKKPATGKKRISRTKPAKRDKPTRGDGQSGKTSARIHQGVGLKTTGQTGTKDGAPEEDISPEYGRKS
jgi:hypothetical protein